MLANPTSKIAQAKAALLAQQQQQQQQPLQPRSAPSPVKIQFGDRTNAFKSPTQSPTFATLKTPTLNKTPNIATNVSTTITPPMTASPTVTRTFNPFTTTNEPKAPIVTQAPPPPVALTPVS
ncbi:hypothetical protein BGZ52_010059, partial [Haplosporangium bisporale]